MQLFDAQGDTVQSAIDGKNHSFHFLTLVIHFAGVINTFGPTDVRNVDEAVDAIFHFHESAKSGEAFHGTSDDAANGETIFNRKPGVGFHLFHSQGDTAVFLVQFQDDGIHIVANFYDAAGVCDFSGPAHFRDVYQAFHARLHLDESAEGFHTDHFAGHADAFGIFDFDVFPRVGDKLLHTQGDFVCVGIEFDDFHLHLVSDAEHIGGVIHFSPAHIGEVQKAVDAAQVDERAILSYIFNLSIQLIAHFNAFEQFLALDGCFFFLHHFAGEDDVSFALVQAHHFELQFFTDELVEVWDGFDGHVRSGQESFHTHHVHNQATFHAATDGAAEHGAVFGSLFDELDVFDVVGFTFGKRKPAFTVVQIVDEDHDVGIHFRNSGIFEFCEGDGPVALESDIHHHVFISDADHSAFLHFAAPEPGIVFFQQAHQLVVELFLRSFGGCGFQCSRLFRNLFLGFRFGSVRGLGLRFDACFGLFFGRDLGLFHFLWSSLCFSLFCCFLGSRFHFGCRYFFRWLRRRAFPFLQFFFRNGLVLVLIML